MAIERLLPGDGFGTPDAIQAGYRTLLVACLGWVMVIYFLPPLYFITGVHRGLERRLMEADRLHLTPQLLDSRGRFLGAMPYFKLEKGGMPRAFYEGEAFFGRHYSSAPPDLKPHGNQADLSEHYWSTVFVQDPNPHFIGCLKLLEDQTGEGSWRTPHGVDVEAPARLAWYTAKHVARGQLRFAGGSSLTAQFQQSVGFDKDSGWGLLRKVSEYLFRTPVMAHYVQREQRRYTQLAARLLPHAQSLGSGRSLMGLEMASRVMFGKAQSRLTPAEAFVLAATIKRQPFFGVASGASRNELVDFRAESRSNREAARRWAAWTGGPNCRPSGAICRAKICAQSKPLHANKDDIVRDLDALDNLARALPVPHSDEVVAKLAAERLAERGKSPSLWILTARDPLQQAEAILPRVQEGVTRELQNAFGHNWGSAANAIRLSIDAEDELRFDPAIDASMRKWFRKQREAGRLNPIFYDWADGADTCSGPGVGCPDIVLAVSDSSGRIVRYYATRQSGTYFGMGNASKYGWQSEQRQVASIAKVGAALIFARAGRTIDDKLLRAFAYSNSEEIEGALVSLPSVNCGSAALAPATVCFGTNDIQSQLRWSDQSSLGLSTKADVPSKAFSFGTLSASPRTVHHDMSAILNAFLGRSDPVRAPTLIEQVTYLDFIGGKVSAPRSRLPDYQSAAPGDAKAPLNWLRQNTAKHPGEFLDQVQRALNSPSSNIYPDRLVPPSQRQAVMEMLRSPVCYKGRGGTLAGLSEWCDKTRLIFGKTGTYDISKSFSDVGGVAPGRRGITHTIWMAGGLQFLDQRAYSFVLMIAGPDPRTPIALPQGTPNGELEASDAAELMNFVLHDVAEHPPHRSRAQAMVS